MMLEPELKEQLNTIFANLQAEFVFDITVSAQHPNRKELLELLDDVTASSPRITSRVSEGEGITFVICKEGKPSGIKFRGVPGGHEFSSLLLAILNLDGKGKNFPDERISHRVSALKGPIHLSTYVMLDCTICPDIVQALNMMTILNSNITHETVIGDCFQGEMRWMKIARVPAIVAGTELLHVGTIDLEELLTVLEAKYNG